jgi:DNA (cytosine-5)-methyltransferase 1
MRTESLFKEIIVDNFAGGGGTSTGIYQATGRHVDVAINHDPSAIAMHQANHPETRHYCESVWEVDPREAVNGMPVALCWLSPDCTHFSKSRGGKPVSKNIRGLAWVGVRWAATVKPRVIMLENVEEFCTWGPIDDETNLPCPIRKGETFEGYKLALTTGLGKNHPAWKDAYAQFFQYKTDVQEKLELYKAIKHGCGYQVEFKELVARDYGTPQSRKRLFMIARKDGNPIVWPKPTHGHPDSDAVKTGKLKPWRGAYECIDWSIPCHSIFLTKEEGRKVGARRPLAENTMARIFKGLKKYGYSDFVVVM